MENYQQITGNIEHVFHSIKISGAVKNGKVVLVSSHKWLIKNEYHIQNIEPNIFVLPHPSEHKFSIGDYGLGEISHINPNTIIFVNVSHDVNKAGHPKWLEYMIDCGYYIIEATVLE